MNEIATRLPEPLVRQLTRDGGLRRLNQQDAALAARRNDAWEARLLSGPAGFLRDYDLLFRRVTRYLLSQGLDFGESHPHRALAAVLARITTVPADEINRVIQHRHALKYDRPLPPGPDASCLLHRLLDDLNVA